MLGSVLLGFGQCLESDSFFVNCPVGISTSKEYALPQLHLTGFLVEEKKVFLHNIPLPVQPPIK
jgi:hypothetical protein